MNRHVVGATVFEHEGKRVFALVLPHWARLDSPIIVTEHGADGYKAERVIEPPHESSHVVGAVDDRAVVVVVSFAGERSGP